MTYDTVATFSQVTSLLLFVAMFGAVVVYALWPANGSKFDAAQRRALDLGEGSQRRDGQASGGPAHGART